MSKHSWELQSERRVHLQALDRTAEIIAALRAQVQAERQAHAETRRLLALQERVEGLEARRSETKQRSVSAGGQRRPGS